MPPRGDALKHEAHEECAPARRRFVRGGSRRWQPLSFDRRAARSRPMDILCSGPGGGFPDLVARAVGDQLLMAFGQRALVDTLAGAAGQISVSALKAARRMDRRCCWYEVSLPRCVRISMPTSPTVATAGSAGAG